GKKLSQTLSSVKSGDKKIPVSEQLDKDASVFAAAIALTKDAAGGTDKIFSSDFSASLGKMSEALKQDPALTSAIADLVSAAGKDLKDDGKLGGIDIDIPDNPSLGVLLDGIYGTLAGIDENNLTETFDDLADVIDNLEKTGAAEKLKGENPDVLSALSVPGAISGTLEALKGNEALQPLADALTKTAVSSVTDMLGVDSETAKDLVNSTSLDLKNMTDEKAGDVEKMISSAGSVVDSLSGKEGSDVLKNLDTDALQDMLDAIDGSGLINGGSDKLIDAVIGSEAMKDTGFIDDKTLEKIKEGGSGSIGNTLGTAQNAVSIVEELTSEKTDKESVKDNLEWLLENMDDAGADFVKDQLTTDKLTTFGVNPIAAPGVSTLISNLIDEINSAEADSSVNTEAETEALTNLYTFGINSMDTVNKGNIFGSGEGQTSAKTLVDTILASRVTSNALNKTAAPDGKLVNDPLGCNIELSNADKAELVSAINEGLKSSIGTPALEETKSTVLSIAALFGIAGTVDSNYKFIAK
ncbi:MAG: hypothetical protein MJ137_01185, partial [Clostridia bacterium]|nr:hypothetical protein [Clostridia bacterium]